MSRNRPRRGVAMVVVLILLALAGGLVAILGLTVKQLAQLHRLESDRIVLRQMIDSGAAWARSHAGDWPTTDGRLDCPRLDAGTITPEPCRGFITLRPEPNGGPRVERVHVEVSLLRPRGRQATQVAVIRIDRS